MELPVDLVHAIQLALGGLITTLVVDGFKSLSEMFKFDLSKVGTLIAVAASAFVVSVVVGLVNFGLGFVPASFAPILNAVFGFLITLLGAAGLHRRAKMARPQ